MKIILTLTTIPSRLNTPIYGELGIKSNLLSLLNQSYKDYEIHLNIPSHLKLTKIYLLVILNLRFLIN